MRHQGPVQLIGTSQAIEDLKAEVERVSRSDAKVLITGESGSGKEVVARAINDASERAKLFVPVNCAGIPETLLESELFGHVKGSFTGAYRDKPGKLEMADHGTIFMDEIGEMTLRMQGLLLRYLETGEIQKVGAERTARVTDVRVMAATNRNLRELIQQGQFREDLFYRINVIHIDVPPLRERREDIPLLIDFFLARFTGDRSTEAALAAHATAAGVRVPGMDELAEEARGLHEAHGAGYGSGNGGVYVHARRQRKRLPSRKWARISHYTPCRQRVRHGEWRRKRCEQPQSCPVHFKNGIGRALRLRLARQRPPGRERRRAPGRDGTPRSGPARGPAPGNPDADDGRAPGARTPPDGGGRALQEADRGARVVLERGVPALHEPRDHASQRSRPRAQGTGRSARQLQDRAEAVQHGRGRLQEVFEFSAGSTSASCRSRSTGNDGNDANDGLERRLAVRSRRA